MCTTKCNRAEEEEEEKQIKSQKYTIFMYGNLSLNVKYCMRGNRTSHDKRITNKETTIKDNPYKKNKKIKQTFINKYGKFLI